MDDNAGSKPATTAMSKITVINHTNATREIHISPNEAIVFGPHETKEIAAEHRLKITGTGWTIKGSDK